MYTADHPGPDDIQHNEREDGSSDPQRHTDPRHQSGEVRLLVPHEQRCHLCRDQDGVGQQQGLPGRAGPAGSTQTVLVYHTTVLQLLGQQWSVFVYLKVPRLCSFVPW